MRVVLLRPARYLWPFNSERSAFWQPLGLLCIAAAARRAVPGLDLAVWDATGRAWGWRTLGRKLAERRIDMLGIGECLATGFKRKLWERFCGRWSRSPRASRRGDLFLVRFIQPADPPGP